MTKPKTSISLYIFLFIFFLIWGLRATVFYSRDNTIPSDFWRLIYSQSLKFALWIIPIFWFITFYEKHALVSSLKLSLPKSQFLSMLIWIGIYALLQLGSAALQFGKLPTWPEVGIHTLFLSNLISPLSEEIMFRGFILNKLLNTLSFWQANFLTSLLFAAIHLPYWLMYRGLNQAVISDLIGVTIFSLVVGYFFKKFNSLIPSIITHIANNLIPNFF